jgi:hypothetical protein
MDSGCCSWLNQGGTTELFKASVPGCRDGGFLFLCRLMKTATSFLLGLEISSTYRGGYACGGFFACGLAGRQF